MDIHESQIVKIISENDVGNGNVKVIIKEDYKGHLRLIEREFSWEDWNKIKKHGYYLEGK